MTEFEPILRKREPAELSAGGPDRLRLEATPTDAAVDTQKRSYENYLRIKRGVGDEALKAAGLPPAEDLSYEAYVAALGAKSPAQPAQHALARQGPDSRARQGSEPLRAKPSLRLQRNDGAPDVAPAPRRTEGAPPRLRRNLITVMSSMLSLVAVFLVGMFLMEVDLSALLRDTVPAQAGEAAHGSPQSAPAETESVSQEIVPQGFVPLAVTEADDMQPLSLPPEVTELAVLPEFSLPDYGMAAGKTTPGQSSDAGKAAKPKKKSAKAAKNLENGNAGSEWTPPSTKVVKSKHALPATTPPTTPVPAKLPKSTPTSSFWRPLMEFFAVSEEPDAIAGDPGALEPSYAARAVKLREDRLLGSR